MQYKWEHNKAKPNHSISQKIAVSVLAGMAHLYIYISNPYRYISDALNLAAAGLAFIIYSGCIKYILIVQSQVFSDCFIKE